MCVPGTELFAGETLAPIPHQRCVSPDPPSVCIRPTCPATKEEADVG